MADTVWSADPRFTAMYDQYRTMNPGQQSRFVAHLRETIGDKDTDSLLMLFSLHRMFTDVDYYNAMKEAVKEQVVKEIFG